MKIVDEFFTWTKQERLGVIILSVLLMLIVSVDLFFNRIYPFKDHSIHPDSLVVYEKLLEDLEREVLPRENGHIPSKKNDPITKSKHEIKLFDPNDLELEGWIELGFSTKQATSLLKYKRSIGGFKDKSDLASSYVVSEEKFRELEGFIQIKEKVVIIEEPNEIREPIEFPKLYLDINSADSITLLKLKGIGPFYASKIISYRKALGNYVELDQLMEIWKFDSIKYREIKDEIWVDTTKVLKIRLNSDSISVLKSHPYIDWNHANAIINFRKQHGEYTSLNDLKKIVIFSDSLILKLKPYISLD